MNDIQQRSPAGDRATPRPTEALRTTTKYSAHNPYRDRSNRPPGKFLELLYPLPRQWLWADHYERYHHRDLPGLTDDELARELSRAWRRLTFEWPNDPDHWLWQRRQACFAERDRRRHQQRRPS